MTDSPNYLDLKRYRKAIGADLAHMVEILQLVNTDESKMRKMENGDEPIPESALNILKAKLVIWRAEQKLGPTPNFIIGRDMTADGAEAWVLHTQNPRFLAGITDEPIDGLVCASGDGLEWLAVTQWLDKPLGDPLEVLNRAVEQFLFYRMHSF